MSGRFETLELRIGGPGAGLAVPGRIQRLLAATLGIQAEEVGAIEPIERGRTRIEIALARSRRISTPAVLPFIEGGRTSLWELRRPSDPVSEGCQTWILSTERGDLPSPGEIATALQETFSTQIGAEEIGLGFAGGSWVRLELPERLSAFAQAPTSLTVGKKKLKIEVLH